MEIPKIGSIWRHHSGTLYVVVGVANRYAEDAEKWPVIVTYRGAEFPERLWARPLKEWLEKMTEVES